MSGRRALAARETRAAAWSGGVVAVVQRLVASLSLSAVAGWVRTWKSRGPSEFKVYSGSLWLFSLRIRSHNMRGIYVRV